jgi:hypothetical protein
MRDGEGKVLTAGNMFYNTLSARQALHWHRRWSRRRPSTPTLMPSTSLSRRRCRHPDVVSGMNLLYLYLQLISTRLTYTVVIKQADLRQCQMSGTYLLITALCGMWRRSNWHPRTKKYLEDCLCRSSNPSTYLNYAYWFVPEVHMLRTHTCIRTWTVHAHKIQISSTDAPPAWKLTTVTNLYIEANKLITISTSVKLKHEHVTMCSLQASSQLAARSHASTVSACTRSTQRYTLPMTLTHGATQNEE